jgi:hypothetical protein
MSRATAPTTKECKVFSEHRYVPNVDSSLDIECDGDTGGNHASDFGTTGCEYLRYRERTYQTAQTKNWCRQGDQESCGLLREAKKAKADGVAHTELPGSYFPPRWRECWRQQERKKAQERAMKPMPRGTSPDDPLGDYLPGL